MPSCNIQRLTFNWFSNALALPLDLFIAIFINMVGYTNSIQTVLIAIFYGNYFNALF